MKHKFSSMGRVAIALVLALSLCLMTGVPVSAAAVGTPTVTLSSYLAEETDVQHTISFNIGMSLNVGQDIIITFDGAYVTPTTWENGDVTVDGVSIDGTSVGTSGDVVTINLPVTISTIDNPVVVVFTSAANIPNPIAGTTYAISVATTAETEAATSETYTILALPTVTNVQPASGNVGDTMWVEVTGANFTGTNTITNVSTTTINFGTEVTVVSTKYVSDTSIDCQITINTAGTLAVAATTAAGTGTVTEPFIANPLDTAQVDVWTKYTPDDAIFDSETLVFDDDIENPFATITEGIATADAGTSDDPQVLIVHAATYAETLIVNQDYVTLLSLSGADSTIIDGGSAAPIVSVTHLSVTLDDFTIQGDATTTNQAGILVNGLTVSGFAIQNNKFVDIAGDNLKVWSDDGAITSGVIDTNTLTGLGADAQRACILVESGSTNNIEGVDITDNIISNFQGVDTHEWPGIQVAEVGTGDISNITITGNVISDGATGIKITGGVTGLTSTYAIADNTISGMFEAGVSADKESDEWPVFDLENNIITGNKYGIELGESAESYTLKYNDISGNTWGLFHYAGAGITITAKYNWWGDISGPSSGSELSVDRILDPEGYWSDKASTALGSGDPMCKDVDSYDPWLTTDQATAVSDGIAYHGSTTPLEAGWNTLSVPLALDDGADTIAEIEALGDFLNDVVIVYQYIDNDWQNVGTSAIELVPGRGYYIKTSAVVYFPVLYSGALGLPAFDLSAGWNLIGSAFGIDKDLNTDGDGLGPYGIAAYNDADGNGKKLVTTALDSIADSCSVVVSPTMPGQEAPWALTVLTAGSTVMYVGEGYWVFMTAPATLAGFEVTPIYWIK